VKLQDEALAVIANVGHPLRHAKKLALYGLAPYRGVVNRANMPMRRLREGEFRDCGLRFPQHLLETTSAFATLALLALASQSEPYELVTRKGGDGFARRQTADQRIGPSPTRADRTFDALARRWSKGRKRAALLMISVGSCYNQPLLPYQRALPWPSSTTSPRSSSSSAPSACSNSSANGSASDVR
jgi:hypothetical protein